MKPAIAVLGIVVVLAAAWSQGVAQDVQQPRNAKEPVFVSADAVQFKEVVPGVSKAVLWGDHDSGPYGAFTKFAPGLDNGMHTHTNDVRIVVLNGAYLYKDGAGEKRVGSGQFILVPGGLTHWSGADAAEGALFYEESSGKFDLVPATELSTN